MYLSSLQQRDYCEEDGAGNRIKETKTETLNENGISTPVQVGFESVHGMIDQLT